MNRQRSLPIIAAVGTGLLALLVLPGTGPATAAPFVPFDGADLVRVSAASDGDVPTGEAFAPVVSRDGDVVVFLSDAIDLPGTPDVTSTDVREELRLFRTDRGTGTTTYVADLTVGNEHDCGTVPHVDVDDDGSTIAFTSRAALAADDDNDVADVYVWDDGAISRVSLGQDGTQADGPSCGPSLSVDGALIAFDSDATNLTPTTGTDQDDGADVFVRDRTAMTTSRISPVATATSPTGSVDPSIAGDGTLVAFESVTADGTRTILLHDTSTGDTQSLAKLTGATPDGDAWDPVLSTDGSSVVFTTDAANLVAATTGVTNIVAVDTATGGATLVSVGEDGAPTTADSWGAAPDTDGGRVAFTSILDPGDGTGARPVVLVRDLATATTSVVSDGAVDARATGPAGAPASAEGTLSDAGHILAFASSDPAVIGEGVLPLANVFVRTSQLTPRAVDDEVITRVGMPATVDVLVNDVATNQPLDPGTLAITTAPARGQAEVIQGEIVITPDDDTDATDHLTYRICDTSGTLDACDEATVTITVTPDDGATGTASPSPTTPPATAPSSSPAPIPAPSTAQTRATVDRIAGEDRVATAVAVSRALRPDGSRIVYLASADDFPDALVTGPVAARRDAPVLLVRGGPLPPVLMDELTRLSPEQIVIVGGPVAVDPETEDRIRAVTSAEVVRVAGPDRYATAATLVTDLPPTTVDEVLVAVGTNFPDALAGGPAAGTRGALLLSPAGGLPEFVRDQIVRLSPARITVLGGTSALGARVEEQLRDLAPTTRIGGADRAATAAALARDRFTPSARAFVTTGEDFPDALAVAPLAIRENAAVLLVEPGRIPEMTADVLRGLSVDRVTVVGGPVAVSTAVEDGLRRLLR